MHDLHLTISCGDSSVHISWFVENVPQGCEAEIEELEHKLADYRDIIEQQEQMIQVGGCGKSVAYIHSIVMYQLEGH